MGDKIHSSKGASFIKVLDGDFSKQLEIPREFTTNFNGRTPHRFILESAITKKCWRVEVAENGVGRVYFRDGWDDFVEAHVLEFGNFLLFEYEEQSIFHVKIYGRNGCEKTTLMDSEGCHQRFRGTSKFDNDEDSEGSKYEENMSKKRRRRTTRKPSLKKYKCGVHKKQNTGDLMCTRSAYRVWISNNIVCFSILMSSKIRKQHQFYRQTIPKAVSVEKKLYSKKQVVFRDAKGNCWPIKLLVKRDGTMYFGQGWRNFLMDSEVAGGDSVNFEFVADDLIQVQVTRTSQAEQHCEEAKWQKEENRTFNMDCEDGEPITSMTDEKVEETSAATERVPSELQRSFSFIWRKTTASNFLLIKKAIARDQNLRSKKSIMLRDPAGKCWPFDLRNCCDGRVCITKGWSNFWKAHQVTPGDCLNFDFVSDNLVEVSIDRGSKPLEPRPVY